MSSTEVLKEKIVKKILTFIFLFPIINLAYGETNTLKDNCINSYESIKTALTDSFILRCKSEFDIEASKKLTTKFWDDIFYQIKPLEKCITSCSEEVGFRRKLCPQIEYALTFKTINDLMLKKSIKIKCKEFNKN